MEQKIVKVMVMLTGDVILVKPYGFGFIDAKGKFYTAKAVQFLEVIE